jgi:COP9 signalosome complex subunit 5
LFYVSVSTKALKKAVEHAKVNPEKQVLGFLIGRMKDYTLIIEDSITNEVESSKTSSKMSPISIAKIADEILHQKVPGNIVGWYHSHPGYGAYMSRIDAETQSKLQQFSPYIVALVIDPSSDEKKFFTLDPKTNSIVMIGEDHIHYFNSGEEPIPSKFKEPPRMEALPPTPIKPSFERNKKSTGIPSKQLYLIIIALLSIGLLITGTFLAISIASGGWISTTLKIEHTPLEKGIIGTDIPIQAKVTGGVGGVENVTLYYRVVEKDTIGSWKKVLMLLVAAGGNTYQYNIPSSEVSGQAVDYYITAKDKAGNTASEPIRTISIADFELEAIEEIEPITVYVGKWVDTQIKVNSINGFESSIKLSIPDRPAGVSVSYPTSITPPKGGSTTVNLRISAISGSPTGKYKMRIEGKYGSITRTLELNLVISDFDITVTPLSIKVSRGGIAEYTIALEVYEGFKDKISFSIEGLPSTYVKSVNFVLNNKELSIPGKTIVLLKIETESSISSGTYTLVIKATGGGLVRDERVTLIIGST